MISDFYKISKDDKIWWAREIVDENIIGGAIYFSFDKKKIFNLLSDYPDKLKNLVSLIKKILNS